MKNKLLFTWMMLLATTFVMAQTQVLEDTELENSGNNNNAEWTSTSTNFGTTWCSVAACGNGGGPMVPRSGTWYSWFGGTASAEIGTISQTFEVPEEGLAELSFWWVVPVGNGSDIFNVSIDGNLVFSMEDSSIIIDMYEEVVVDLGTLSAGTHTIEFYSEKMAGDSHNVGLDDITLTVDTTAGIHDIGIGSGITVFSDFTAQTLTIESSLGEESAQVQLFDVLGKSVLNQEYSLVQPIVINTQAWSSGVYLISVKTGSGHFFSKKVVIK